jgi:hypothetical protein
MGASSESISPVLPRSLVGTNFWWPWSGIVALTIVGAFILYSQVFVFSFAISYDVLFIGTGTGTVYGIQIPKNYTQTETQDYASSRQYNVWTGIDTLWNEGAYILAVFVTAWSGVWPYVKLLILCLALFWFRKSTLPAGYEWLSTIAHYSFIDVWMVLPRCFCKDRIPD